MKIQALDNGTWFDIEKATKYEEYPYWNGNNWISKATNSQWENQTLYQTKSGNWVLNYWSQHQGTRETWNIIPVEEATSWLITNNHEIPKELVEESKKLEV